jgi:Interferon-induced transmembrane protein
MEESHLIKPPKPDNYLVWAILTTILCCLPFGIVSIVYAAKVDNLYYNGQYEEAAEKAKSAKTWAIVSAGSGLLILILYVIFVVMLGVGMAAFD